VWNEKKKRRQKDEKEKLFSFVSDPVWNLKMDELQNE